MNHIRILHKMSRSRTTCKFEQLLKGPFLEFFDFYFSRIGCLDFVGHVKLPLETVLGAGIEHLGPNTRYVRGPRDEKNLGLLTIVFRDEIEVINSISAILLRKTARKGLVTCIRSTHLLYDDLLGHIVDFKDDITVGLLPLQLKELEFTFIVNGHPRGGIGHGEETADRRRGGDGKASKRRETMQERYE